MTTTTPLPPPTAGPLLSAVPSSRARPPCISEASTGSARGDADNSSIHADDDETNALVASWRASLTGPHNSSVLEAEIAALDAELMREGLLLLPSSSPPSPSSSASSSSDPPSTPLARSPAHGANVSITARTDAELLAELARPLSSCSDEDAADDSCDEPLPTNNAAWRRWFDENGACARACVRVSMCVHTRWWPFVAAPVPRVSLTAVLLLRLLSFLP
jgi:hypothetical protein